MGSVRPHAGSAPLNVFDNQGRRNSGFSFLNWNVLFASGFCLNVQPRDSQARGEKKLSF